MKTPLRIALGLCAASLPACGSPTSAEPPADAGAADATVAPQDDAGPGADAADASDSGALTDAEAGPGTVVLAQATTPTGIAVDSQHVYWADWNGPSIRRANLDGSGATTLLSADFTTLAFPADVVLSGDYVYWDNFGSSSGGLPAAARCPKVGGTSVGEGMPSSGPFSYGTGLAAADGGLVWAGLVQWTSTNGFAREVWWIDTADDGGSGPLVTDLFATGGIAVTGGEALFGVTNGGPDQIASVALDAPLLGIDGGPSPYQVVATCGSGPTFSPPNVVTDGTSIYYVDQEMGVVGALPVAGTPDGGPPAAIATGIAGPMRIAIDDSNVYFTVQGHNSADGSAEAFDDGAVMTCPKTGCGAAGPTVLAAGLPTVSGYLAVDGSSVYFTVRGDGTVRKVGK